MKIQKASEPNPCRTRLALKISRPRAVNNRILLGFVIANCLVLGAAPIAHAVTLPECGNSYALELHGTEPAVSGASPLNYIAGVGQITFGPPAKFAVRGQAFGCTVTHLKMIYNDNAALGFSASPAHCLDADTVLGTGIPCFDGEDHEAAPGGLVGPSGSLGVAATLSITPSFDWLNGTLTSASLPLSFNLDANAGASTIVGTSVAPMGPDLSPGSPPANPVLTIVMQKQASRVTLPVEGPNNPPGCVLPNCNGYGVAPYVGLSVISLEGYNALSTAPSMPPVAPPGTYSSAVGEFQIFSQGFADGGGTITFNNDANLGIVGPPLAQANCYFLGDQLANFADGTNNNNYIFGYNGSSSTCSGTNSQNGGNPPNNFFNYTSGVQWGATDTSSYFILTSTDVWLSDRPNVATVMQLGTSYPSAPAGALTNLVAPQTLIAPNKTSTGYVDLENTSPDACISQINLLSTSDGICSLSLVSYPGGTPSPVQTSEAPGTPLTQYATVKCTCTTSSPPDSVSTTLGISELGHSCPPSGTTLYTITCKN